jgi:hypothetical protein
MRPTQDFHKDAGASGTLGLRVEIDVPVGVTHICGRGAALKRKTVVARSTIGGVSGWQRDALLAQRDTEPLLRGYHMRLHRCARDPETSRARLRLVQP